MKIGKQRTKIRPQSAILTLYGDYLLDRREEIGIGSLITILGNFGLSAQAVRSAVARMSYRGLLTSRSQKKKSYYSLTTEGHKMLTEGAERIFVRKETSWDGNWNIVTYTIPERRRKMRDTLRRELAVMGYGSLGGATFISPYDLSEEVGALVKKLRITEHVQLFRAAQQGATDARQIVALGWDLPRIHERYAWFMDRYEHRYEDRVKRIKAGDPPDAGEYFVERFFLIHEYRRLPFYDPDLPAELLPEGWLRPAAADLFHNYHDLLNEKANEYLRSVMDAY